MDATLWQNAQTPFDGTQRCVTCKTATLNRTDSMLQSRFTSNSDPRTTLARPRSVHKSEA
eukprot:2385394-Amphidinium_carterae.1